VTPAAHAARLIAADPLFRTCMSDNPVISVQHLAKAYRIWNSPSARLTSPFQESLSKFLPGMSSRWRKGGPASSYRDFWALKDVSFELNPGEAFGVVGRNGSGKSTLLQMVAGTLQPTAGLVRVEGRVAALLELGSGFNHEFTGRENVYMNASILGLSRPQIDARFDAIAGFADIGAFMEEPVKTYSTGMVVRLAFAVCAHVDADVLIIDEALAVGDARFQLKCARTIERMVDDGRTLLFVSHDLNSVKRLCHRAALLDGGRLLYLGRPNTVANLYSKLMASDEGAAAVSEDIKALHEPAVSHACSETPARVLPANEVTRPTGDTSPELAVLQARLALLQVQLSDIAAAARTDPRAGALQESERGGREPATGEYAYGGELGEISQCAMAGSDGAVKTLFTTGESVEVRLCVRAAEDVVDPIYALTIKSRQGQEVYGTNSLYNKQPAPDIRAGEEADVAFRLPLNLIAGEYFLSVGWTKFVGDKLLVIHRRYDAIKFTVLGIDRAFGIAHLPTTIEVTPHATVPA
jgi:ABC-type polysaccharide/polyol phosphate transport system ATPase subunit